MRGRPVRCALVTLLVLGCAAPRPTATPAVTDAPAATAEPTTTPEPTPAPSLPTWFGEALVVVGSTGEFVIPKTRTEELPAWLVVWRDGVVSATEGPRDQPPVYRSIQLEQADLDELDAMLDGALADYIHEPGEGDRVICVDCNPVLIQLDIDGRLVEIVVPHLVDGRMSYPPQISAIVAFMRSAAARVHRSTTPWMGTMPTMLVAPPSVGG